MGLKFFFLLSGIYLRSLILNTAFYVCWKVWSNWLSLWPPLFSCVSLMECLILVMNLPFHLWQILFLHFFNDFHFASKASIFISLYTVFPIEKVTQQAANWSTEVLIAFHFSLKKVGIVKSRLASWLAPQAVYDNHKNSQFIKLFCWIKLVLKEAGVKSLVSYITVALCIPETPSFSKQSAWVHPLWPADM